eukprot:gb/GFBE01043634.1/.p2 GENE.gb/GFBE01043634.1/~~gb/GFBE01043634.1/.p2  ORF type:complete len:227 (-),score=69.34 gb/GFBE01043634.1/:115-795(-)
MPYKLQYFGIPALAEPIRILLHLGKFDWTDDRIDFKEWPNIKPTTKWGQVPLLITPDGKELTQTKAIVRYLAAQVNCKQGFLSSQKCYPGDLMLRFQIDEMIDVMEDVRQKIRQRCVQIKDQAEKEAARQQLFADGGDCDVLLKKIESLVGDKYMVGNALTVADIWCFFFLNFLRCGFLDGIPKDYLVKYPRLKAIVANVSAHPEIKAYYNMKDLAKEPMYACFVE